MSHQSTSTQCTLKSFADLTQGEGFFKPFQENSALVNEQINQYIKRNEGIPGTSDIMEQNYSAMQISVWSRFKTTVCRWECLALHVKVLCCAYLQRSKQLIFNNE